MDSKDIYVELVQILKLIALSPEKQIQILPDFVDVPDEIALAYDDIYLMIPQIVKEKVISIRIHKLLEDLNQLFNDMSGNTFFWSMEYFKNGESWKNIRQLASSILEKLDEANDIPNVGFIQWVK